MFPKRGLFPSLRRSRLTGTHQASPPAFAQLKGSGSKLLSAAHSGTGVPPRLLREQVRIPPGRTPRRHAARRRPPAPSTPSTAGHAARASARAPSAEKTLPPAPGPCAGRGWQLSEKFQPSSSTAGGGRSTDGRRRGQARAESRRDVGVGGAAHPARKGPGGAPGRGWSRESVRRGGPPGPGRGEPRAGAHCAGPGSRRGLQEAGGAAGVPGWRAAATYPPCPGPTAAPPGRRGCRRRGASGTMRRPLGERTSFLASRRAATSEDMTPPERSPAARRPYSAARPEPSGAPPRPASVADSARVQSPSQAQSTGHPVLDPPRRRVLQSGQGHLLRPCGRPPMVSESLQARPAPSGRLN